MNKTNPIETAKNAAKWALSKVGCPYSQPQRLREGVFDCSSLVARAYSAQGKRWLYGGSVPLSCQEVYDDDFELLWPSSYADIGKRMGGKETIQKGDRAGDIQFICTDSSTSRSNRITHVAMVTAGNRIVHARGKAYGVVTSSINTYSGKVCAVVRYNPACTLRKGMRGYRTQSLQKALSAAGYRLSADGNYGSQTLKAVREYQKANDLPDSGQADHVTLIALGLITTDSASDNVDSSLPDATGHSSTIQITGPSVNMRTGPGTEFDIMHIAHAGEQYEKADTALWLPVRYGNSILWIAARYVRTI